MQWIKDIVEGLIEVYDTRDVRELINLLEVTIIYKNFINPDVKARLFKDPFENYYVYLSNQLTEQEERCIIAHEIGHILLHDISCDYYTTSNINRGKLEIQANYFASLLLLDESTMDKVYLENLSIDQLSAYFEVPKELIQYRLDEVI